MGEEGGRHFMKQIVRICFFFSHCSVTPEESGKREIKTKEKVEISKRIKEDKETKMRFSEKSLKKQNKEGFNNKELG